ncbi:MAG: glycosyltransferase [Thermodesulfobacteriota bacterium]
MSQKKSPLMSVIITTIGSYESIRTTVKYLRRQTVKEHLEVIIISPQMDVPESDRAGFSDFYDVILMEADLDHGLYDAWVSAVNRAGAPVVAFGENHAFPEPQWAEALIEAHEGPWAGVGSVIKNANPGSTNSRAQQYMTYGRYSEPVESGETDDLPGHNVSYKRSILLEYGSDLRYMLIRTNIMNMDLRSQGYRLYMEGKAGVNHVNVSKTVSILLDLFYNGQIYTAALAHYKRWSPAKRFLYALLEPLIILKHFQGTLHAIRRAGKRNELIPAALPIIITGLTAHFIGKLWGYAAGFGTVQKRINSFEFDRFKYITDQDIKRVSNL